MNILTAVPGFVWILFLGITVPMAVWLVTSMFPQKDWANDVLDDKMKDRIKSVAIIATCIAIANYLMSQGDFEWWWKMWLHGPFFVVNATLVFVCYVMMSDMRKFAKAISLGVLVVCVAIWVNVSGRYPSRTGSDQGLVPPTAAARTFRTTHVTVPKGQWSQPFDPRDIVLVEDVSGRFVLYDGKPEEKKVAWPARIELIFPFGTSTMQVMSSDSEFRVEYKVWDELAAR